MKQSVSLFIDPQVVERHPEILVGGFTVEGMDKVRAIPADLFSAMKAPLEEEGLTLQNLPDDPRIRAWREAIGRCGLKPSTFKSSPEQLARRLLKGGEISTPIPVVNAYCAISVRNLAAMGGYDVDLLPVKDLHLRRARPDLDSFQPIGGSARDTPLGEDVVVYASGHEVICYAFNHRDSVRTAIRPETERAVFFSEGIGKEQHDSVRQALGELATLLEKKGGTPGGVCFATSSSPHLQVEMPG